MEFHQTTNITNHKQNLFLTVHRWGFFWYSSQLICSTSLYSLTVIVLVRDSVRWTRSANWFTVSFSSWVPVPRLRTVRLPVLRLLRRLRLHRARLHRMWMRLWHLLRMLVLTTCTTAHSSLSPHHTLSASPVTTTVVIRSSLHKIPTTQWLGGHHLYLLC